jgi:hypothetical protein
MTIQHGVAKSFTGSTLVRRLLKYFRNSEALFNLATVAFDTVAFETVAFEIVERSIVKTCGMGKNFQASAN